MKLIKMLFAFLFGKSPRIFDKEGQVSHKLSSQLWKKWLSRYQNDPEGNWRNHTGIRPKNRKRF